VERYVAKVRRDIDETLVGCDPIGCGTSSMEVIPAARAEKCNCDRGKTSPKRTDVATESGIVNIAHLLHTSTKSKKH
jgi:hypothetical protein